MNETPQPSLNSPNNAFVDGCQTRHAVLQELKLTIPACLEKSYFKLRTIYLVTLLGLGHLLAPGPLTSLPMKRPLVSSSPN